MPTPWIPSRPPTTTTENEKCERMLILEESIQLQLDRLNFLELTLTRLGKGKCKKSQADFDRVTKDIENQRNCIQQQKGGRAPQFEKHCATQIVKRNEEEALKLQYILTNSSSKDNLKTNVTNVNNVNSVNNVNNVNNDEIKNKKNSRAEDFASPTKVAKKQKILQNYSLGADAPINVQNKFTALAGSSAMPDSGNAAVPVAPQDPLYPFEIPTKLQPRYAGSNEEVSKIQIEAVRGTPEDSRLDRGRAPRNYSLL
ncbi:hypothetical protein TNCV_2523981 [Trichonephila clavipes]|nr:hypothetical protein TNCV_2523981 [Trichonephila clavipes]